MGLGIKSLQRTEMKRILEKKFKLIEVEDVAFCGAVGLLLFENLSSPLYVSNPISDNLCIADKNYKWLQFAPQNQNWWLTVMYNEKNELIESYFDITQKNVLTCDNSYFIDMRLDVVIYPYGEAVIVDYDELEDALNKNLITKEEYKLAIDTANNIVNNYNRNKKLFYEYLDKYFQKLYDN